MSEIMLTNPQLEREENENFLKYFDLFLVNNCYVSAVSVVAVVVMHTVCCTQMNSQIDEITIKFWMQHSKQFVCFVNVQFGPVDGQMWVYSK